MDIARYVGEGVIAAFETWTHLFEELPATSQPRVGASPIAGHHAQPCDLGRASNRLDLIASVNEGAVGPLSRVQRLGEGAGEFQRLRPGDQERARWRCGAVHEPGVDRAGQ